MLASTVQKCVSVEIAYFHLTWEQNQISLTCSKMLWVFKESVLT